MGRPKEAILKFVHATTDPSSPDFVPPEERIAEFDQDGTLWVEHPVFAHLPSANSNVWDAHTCGPYPLATPSQLQEHRTDVLTLALKCPLELGH
jgi:hypothetical protein